MITPTLPLIAARIWKIGWIALFAALTIPVLAAPARAHEDCELTQPKALIVAPGTSEAQSREVLLPALRYFTFWNTGEERFAREALSPDFVDLNLPKGRPQGPEGPLVASRTFRQAIPDLRATAEEVRIAGNSVVARLRFRGHFTGKFGNLNGKGQPIAFNAVDIYTIEGGRIRTNWHLEDNLALMGQLGALPAQPSSEDHGAAAPEHSHPASSPGCTHHCSAPASNFAAEMRSAMARMHADMDVRPTGDADRDFTRMMIPHHQGAIDMARTELLYGKDQRLIRLAQSIIVEQSSEISYMNTILGGTSNALTATDYNSK